MEKRLQEYRRLRAQKLGDRSEKVQQTTTLTWNLEDSSAKNDRNGSHVLHKDNKNDADSSGDEKQFKDVMKMIDSKRKESQTFWERYHLEKILKSLLWVCLLGFFIQIGFATVYLIISASYLMYASMTSRSRRTGPSAYSVFNEGCERIDGTFTAEQFEHNLRHGITK